VPGRYCFAAVDTPFYPRPTYLSSSNYCTDDRPIGDDGSRGEVYDRRVDPPRLYFKGNCADPIPPDIEGEGQGDVDQVLDFVPLNIDAIGGGEIDQKIQKIGDQCGEGGGEATDRGEGGGEGSAIEIFGAMEVPGIPLPLPSYVYLDVESVSGCTELAGRYLLEWDTILGWYRGAFDFGTFSVDWIFTGASVSPHRWQLFYSDGTNNADVEVPFFIEYPLEVQMPVMGPGSLACSGTWQGTVRYP